MHVGKFNVETSVWDVSIQKRRNVQFRTAHTWSDTRQGLPRKMHTYASQTYMHMPSICAYAYPRNSRNFYDRLKRQNILHSATPFCSSHSDMPEHILRFIFCVCGYIAGDIRFPYIVNVVCVSFMLYRLYNKNMDASKFWRESRRLF